MLSTEDRATRNRENAAHSTGPRTEDGKSASSQNSLKHGLASGTLLIPGEDPAEYDALIADLIRQHQPQNPGEELAVTDMAQAWWLKRRAIRLQNQHIEDDKKLALYMRYQAAHERGYYRALAELRKLKKEQQMPDSGFDSQEAEDDAKFNDLRERYGDEALLKTIQQDQIGGNIATPNVEVPPAPNDLSPDDAIDEDKNEETNEQNINPEAA
jgi:hypothetical protein